MSNSKFGKINKDIFNSKPYKNLSKIIVVIWILFGPIYLFRDNLYNLNNKYITLFAETAPNLLFSFLFTLIGIFYILPHFKGINSINKPQFILLINVINIIVVLLIEYIHVALNLGSWDNNDIIVSLIGLGLSTTTYFKLRKNFLKIYNK